jgi:hypothetical protein
VAHHSQRRSYAVYPPTFHKRGICWTFRVISRARPKAKSLGIGTWIRRYLDTVDKNGQRDWQIERLWLWNGVRFVRLREEPTMYQPPSSANSFHEKAGRCQGTLHSSFRESVPIQLSRPGRHPSIRTLL